MKVRFPLSGWQWILWSIAGALAPVLLFFSAHAADASIATQTSPFMQQDSQASVTSSAGNNRKTGYTLPPEKLAKAIRLNRDYTILDFAGTAWQILVLILLLTTQTLSRLEDWIKRVTQKRWLQGVVYIPIFLLMILIADLPFGMMRHWLSVSYGLSIQHWGSWFLDHAKSTLIVLCIGTSILLALARLIRKFPRTWWAWFWAGSIPCIITATFLLPVFIDPLFNHFEPLTKSNPALVVALERVVARTGTAIPPNRMYLMKASEKLTVPNAYVTGIGATKRVVVWDTTIGMAPTDDILFIFGHESGHYVLNHIWKGIAFFVAFMLVMMWIGYRLVTWLVARYGRQWRIDSLEDWAAGGVLMLAFVLLSFLSDPIANTYSRSQEHEADVYGQEAIHGIVADPQATAQHSFQLLGEAYLEDPNPNRLLEFWSYDHPSTAHRAAFAADYNPWVDGKQPMFFRKEQESVPSK
jgi:STE24 endopeptidase